MIPSTMQRLRNACLGTFALTLALLFTSGQPSSLTAAGLAAWLKAPGVVASVDDTTHTFTCHGGKRDWTYKTTEKTVYLVGAKNASWSDLKKGAQVEVTYKIGGKFRFADKVVIKE